MKLFVFVTAALSDTPLTYEDNHLQVPGNVIKSIVFGIATNKK